MTKEDLSQLEYCCLMVQLRSGAIIIGYSGILWALIYCGLILIIVFTEEIMNTMELVRISFLAAVALLAIIGSIFLLVGVHAFQRELLSVWMGFAGTIIFILTFLTIWNIYFEFSCIFPVLDLLLVGGILYSVFVVYSHYQVMSEEELELRRTGRYHS